MRILILFGRCCEGLLLFLSDFLEVPTRPRLRAANAVGDSCLRLSTADEAKPTVELLLAVALALELALTRRSSRIL